MLATDPPPVISIDDDKITQRQAAKLMGVSFPTASRYMTAGRLGVRLPSAKVGGKRHTTREAVAWWFGAVQVAEAARHAPAPPADDRDDDEHDFEAEADRLGL